MCENIVVDLFPHFRKVLSEAGYKLTDDGLSVIYLLESDNSSLSSYGDCDDNVDNEATDLQYNNEDLQTENWDI